MVVVNLKTKKRVDCLPCLLICRLNPYRATRWQLFETVRNFGSSFLHDGHSGRHLIVDEHRSGEVAVGEHLDDVSEMGTDRLYVFGILAIISGHFNGSAVRIQAKMMSCLLMRKSHRFITVFLHIRLMLRTPIRLFLVHRTMIGVLSSYLERT